jgi:cytochrome c-type biogenesis protein
MFDFRVTGAFLAGLVSFLSPCVLPMVPFYLSYLAGVSVNTVAGRSRPVSARAPARGPGRAVFAAGC